MTILASAIPEKLKGVENSKTGHVTRATPLLRMVSRPKANTSYSL